jgi:hypothetical protein
MYKHQPADPYFEYYFGLHANGTLIRESLLLEERRLG